MRNIPWTGILSVIVGLVLVVVVIAGLEKIRRDKREWCKYIKNVKPTTAVAQCEFERRFLESHGYCPEKSSAGGFGKSPTIIYRRHDLVPEPKGEKQ